MSAFFIIMNSDIKANHTSAQSISLLLKPASCLCNLSCEYCFYNRVHDLYPGSSKKMSALDEETIICNTLSANAMHNSFCWQGGEPMLMGIDFFRDAVEFQKRYSQPGQIIENSIQTNGVLINEEWCRFFLKENFLVGISLDGPKDIHDFYRKKNDGSGSFDDVMKSISMMKKFGVEFNILCLLTDRNIKFPVELYNFFRSHGFNFIQFINCFENDAAGDLKKISVRGEETGEFYIRLFDQWYRNDFSDVSIRFFEDILMYYVDGVKASCCYNNICSSYIVVENNGDCYPCDFYVYEKWNIGNLANSSIQSVLKNPQRAKFASLKSNISEECRKCDISGFCLGDCTRFRTIDNISEYCISMKMIYNHIEPYLPEIKRRVAEIRNK